MKFKPGDLIEPAVQRIRFKGEKLALVVEIQPPMKTPHPPDRMRIQWVKTGLQVWEYPDLFKKLS